jgi:hypothetical protein
MIEVSNAAPNAPDDSEANVGPFDAASYIFQLSLQLARMAEANGLSRLAAALELSRGLAGEALAELAVQSLRSANAAPDEAT